MPEMASIKDDFPALCWPITAITGKSMSSWTLHSTLELDCEKAVENGGDIPSAVKSIDDVQQASSMNSTGTVGQTDTTSTFERYIRRACKHCYDLDMRWRVGVRSGQGRSTHYISPVELSQTWSDA